MPTKAQLPDGPRRQFVEELFVHYREADRPTLRVVARWIAEHKDSHNLRGTASAETVRKVMVGTVVPRAWATVETILEALCGLAGRGVDEERWPAEEGDRWDTTPSRTFKEELKQRWHAVLDDYEAEVPELPARQSVPVATSAVHTPSSTTIDDPWATGPAGGFGGGFGGSEAEPPF